ncbi:hypothetical protein ND748_02855 [Frankia sp. AiPs1]|uniref:hypothetical protein n=1 Tax=Frankia sp. AiPs1 TaxID=573493 RepID=UPI002042D7D2|nr:hypothetical protein [Frankia sp. AiPs1]MCM3920620.1 hypothetical protein [Frankia sp. AiPs1]
MATDKEARLARLRALADEIHADREELAERVCRNRPELTAIVTTLAAAARAALEDFISEIAEP